MQVQMKEQLLARVRKELQQWKKMRMHCISFSTSYKIILVITQSRLGVFYPMADELGVRLGWEWATDGWKQSELERWILESRILSKRTYDKLFIQINKSKLYLPWPANPWHMSHAGRVLLVQVHRFQTLWFECCHNKWKEDTEKSEGDGGWKWESQAENNVKQREF